MPNKYKREQDAIDNVNLDAIKVRDQDELDDDDSEGSEIGGDREDEDGVQRMKSKAD